MRYTVGMADDAINLNIDADTLKALVNRLNDICAYQNVLSDSEWGDFLVGGKVLIALDRPNGVLIGLLDPKLSTRKFGQYLGQIP